MSDLLLIATNLRRLAGRRASKWQRYWSHQLRRWTKGTGETVKAARAIGDRTVKAGQQAAANVRWSVVRKRGIQTAALVKLSVNSRQQRDVFALSILENHLVRQAAGMLGSVWISPLVVHRSVRQISPPNVLSCADLSSLLRPVGDEPTINFMYEIVGERRPYRDTTLFREVESGKVRRKRFGPETVTLTTANFEQYYEKCMRQAELVATHGLRPWDKSKALSYDGDIAVLLSAGGELIFLRRGTHRLGIARALRLPRIPVQIYMVTGSYLAEAAEDSGWYLPWRLSSAMRHACDRAMPTVLAASDVAARGVDDLPREARG